MEWNDNFTDWDDNFTESDLNFTVPEVKLIGDLDIPEVKLPQPKGLPGLPRAKNLRFHELSPEFKI